MNPEQVQIAELVSSVRRRLYEQKGGEHPESIEVIEEITRMFLEAQKIIGELRRDSRP